MLQLQSRESIEVFNNISILDDKCFILNYIVLLFKLL